MSDTQAVPSGVAPPDADTPGGAPRSAANRAAIVVVVVGALVAGTAAGATTALTPWPRPDATLHPTGAQVDELVLRLMAVAFVAAAYRAPDGA